MSQGIVTFRLLVITGVGGGEVVCCGWGQVDDSLPLEWGQVADSFKLIYQFCVTWATPCSCVRVKEKWERSWI